MVSALFIRFRFAGRLTWRVCSSRRVSKLTLILRLSTFVVIGMDLVSVSPAEAQQAPINNDYYQFRNDDSYRDTQRHNLLRTVEINHLGLGREKLRTRYYESAFGEFAFILLHFPNHPQGLMGMVEVCRNWKTPKCSMDVFFERAVAVNPNAGGTYVTQGIYLARQGRYPAAIDSYRRSLELEADSPNAHYNLGLAYFETKQFERANEHAQKAYELGFPLPGLREKLKRSGHWKPIASPRTEAPATPPRGTDGSSGASGRSASTPGTGESKAPTK